MNLRKITHHCHSIHNLPIHSFFFFFRRFFFPVSSFQRCTATIASWRGPPGRTCPHDRTTLFTSLGQLRPLLASPSPPLVCCSLGQLRLRSRCSGQPPRRHPLLGLGQWGRDVAPKNQRGNNIAPNSQRGRDAALVRDRTRRDREKDHEEKDVFSLFILTCAPKLPLR